jgi:tetratricopeptide (TPR) repeat protein
LCTVHHFGKHLSLDNRENDANVTGQKEPGRHYKHSTKRRGIMRQNRTIVGLMLALGLGLLLVAPAMAQAPGPLPPDVYGPIAKGYDLIMDGKYDAAAAEFLKATQKDKNNPFALNNLAAIEAQKGNYKTAMALLQQALPQAANYKDKVAQTCFVAGLCNAVKPTKEMGATSTIAPIIQENIAKLQPKLEAMPPKPAEPPPMSPKK